MNITVETETQSDQAKDAHPHSGGPELRICTKAKKG